MSTETILASYKSTRACPTLTKNGKITVTAQAYQLGNNAHPHFSVTAEVLSGKRWEMGGCLHEEVLRYFPKLKPLVYLHLSNADDGEPMYAEENGFYNLAGSIEGNFGEKYHRGNDEIHFPITPDPETPWINTECRKPTKEECLQMTAEHLRVSLEAAKTILEDCAKAFKAGADTVAMSDEVSAQAHKLREKAASASAKECFAKFCATLRPQWKAEAEAGIELIKSLNKA